MDVHELKISCQKCRLSELCLPYGLESEELDRLEHIVQRPAPLRRGEVLYRAGGSFHAIYAVRSGALKIFSGSEDGHEQILGFYLPGELLGLDGMDKDLHKCTAVALETSSVCTLPFNQLSVLCEKIPGLQKRLFRLIGREIGVEHELLLMMGQKDAEERLAIFLVTLAARFKRRGYSQSEFRLPMSRHDLANYLGLTPETVSRLFGRFRKNGLIETNRSLVKLLDMSRLVTLCAGPEDAGRLAAVMN
ncbi:MAG: fumarate/nitrate reduction transcriptional regulator Fnr [Gammaproteobacteria bacterium]|nr:fumarate/nitrate reduction transcriptional regulator Fnr [Gammaproteobacteria bacterium]